MKQAFAALCALTLCAACSSPTEPNPAVVVMDAVLIDNAAGDRWRITVRFSGGFGSYRIGLRDGRGVARCVIAGGAINSGARATNTYACAGAVVSFFTVDSQDGASPAWRRTGCFAFTGPCPTLPD